MVVKKEDYGLTGADAASTMANLIAPLAKEHIEKLTIEAIREHRDALNRAESAHQAWKASEAAGDQRSTEAFHEAYTMASLAHQAQHMVVATLIDRLGYILRHPLIHTHENV